MRTLFCAFVVTVAMAASARAETIVWIDDGELTFSQYPFRNVPPVGTPWALQVSFDANVVGTPRQGGGPSCFAYPIESASLTFGGFNYTTSSGRIATNFNFQSGCSFTETGYITLELGRWNAQEPSPWNLSDLLLLAMYEDAIQRDGALPIVPTPTGFNLGLTFIDPFGNRVMSDHQFSPRELVDNPAPVPEPGTMTLLGIGLAYAARRRWQNRVA